MRILLFSDIHLELLGPPHIKALTARLLSHPSSLKGDARGVDVVVAAGDIGTYESAVLRDFNARLVDRYGVLVEVPGNHEFYGMTARDVERALPFISRARPERNFVCATLWSPPKAQSWHLRRNVSDFDRIRPFGETAVDGAILSAHARDRRFLIDNVKASDVVVTHHMPSHACVAPRWRGSPLNDFFACDDMDEVLARQPAIWFCGHTHDDVDVVVNGTRVVARPCGYRGERLGWGGYRGEVFEVETGTETP